MNKRCVSNTIRLIAGLLLAAVACEAQTDTSTFGMSSADAERNLKAVLDSNPDSFEAKAAYIRFLNRHERPEDAIIVLRSLKSPDKAATSLLWAEMFWYQGNTEDALRTIEEAGDYGSAELELLIRMDYLEGKIERCEENCRELLRRDPLNKAARLFTARLQLRRGDYADALQVLEAADLTHPDDLEILECRAKVFDAQGKPDEAETLRRSMADLINANPPRTVNALTAAAGAMRAIGEPKAALQCLQAALRYDPANPYALLEKVRVFRDTYGLEVAAATANKIIAKYDGCGLALAELGEILLAFRQNATVVKSVCSRALSADPSLLQARRRLIYYSLISGDWDEAGKLIEKNREFNPNDLLTEELASVLPLLKSQQENGAAQSQEDFDKLAGRSLSASVGDIFAMRMDYEESRKWFERALQRNADDAGALKGLGIAKLRCGEFQEAADCLEEAFAVKRFDPEMKNILEFLDTMDKSELATRGAITVAHQRDDSLLADYVLSMAQAYLDEECRRFGVKSVEPFRIQLCAARGDLDVVTQGIPSYG